MHTVVRKTTFISDHIRNNTCSDFGRNQRADQNPHNFVNIILYSVIHFNSKYRLHKKTLAKFSLNN